MKNKYLKYTLKSLVIFFGIVVILYIILLAYISANKKKIISQVTEEISKKINGNVAIGGIELSFFKSFPQVSVELSDVMITDTLYHIHHHPFLKAEDIYLRLSLIQLIKRKSAVNGFTIERGSVYLYTDTSGYSNSYLFKRKDVPVDDTTNIRVERSQLENIDLKDMRITIDDRRKDKFHDLIAYKLEIGIDDTDPVNLLLDVESDILVQSLAFNAARGSYLKGRKFEGDFALGFDKKTKVLSADSIKLALGGHPFRISATFDLKSPAPQFSLDIHVREVKYSFIRSLLTTKISTALSIMDLDEYLNADAYIKGPLRGGDPLINIFWNTTKTNLKTPFLDFDDATFSGTYTNEVVVGLPRTDANSRIDIRNFSATWKDLPITSANIEILNLTTPVLTTDMQSNFPLSTLNDLIGSKTLELQSGTVNVNMTYKGPLQKNNNSNSFLNGVISLKNSNVLYTPRNVEWKDISGRLVFKSSDLFIENLTTSVFGNRLTMNGYAKNLLTLIDKEPNKVIMNWDITSPALNLNSFTYLLKERKKVEKKSSDKNKLGDLAQKIDLALDQGSINLNVKAGKLIYKKFEGDNVLANVALLPDRYLINNVSMGLAGGKMDLNGSVVTQSRNAHQMNVHTTFTNVDVNRVFKAFNDFGQDGIKAENLQGRLTSNADASMTLNDEGEVIPSSIKSTVDFSLKDGALINHEPVKKLQVFIFKNRDFENIRFAELKNRLEISNQEVKINRMEIASSVMTMFVQGVFSQKGNTDMSIQLPLKNLRTPKSGAELKNIGADKKGGTSIFVRGRPGEDGNIKFKLDLFNKYAKDRSN